uniref:Aa_trans domain-containing protein n=1 Tax=Macrostomum lignano TaxID=282301 RepID=A0A1I8HVS3_9PLAT
YVLIALICLSSVAIGVYTSCTGGRQQTTKEYLLGNRNLQLLPVAISILVSFWSAISLLGSPAEIFYFGSNYNVTAVGISLACIVSATTFVPLFYELEITSIYEVFGILLEK